MEVLFIVCIVEHSDVAKMAFLLLGFSLTVSNAIVSFVSGLGLSLGWGVTGLAKVVCTVAAASAITMTF